MQAASFNSSHTAKFSRAGIVYATLALLGCAGTPANQPVCVVDTVAPSSILWTAPPPAGPYVWTQNWSIAGSNTSGTIHVESSDPRNSPAPIVVPRAKSILVLLVVDRANARYAIASVVNDDDTLSVHRFGELANSTGPDVNSDVVLFTSTTPLYGIDLDIATDGSAAVIDARRGDIWTAADTNSDGWPDTLGSAPFASRALNPELINAYAIEMVASGTVRVGPRSKSHSEHRVSHLGPHTEISDSTGSGTADTFTNMSRR